MHQREVIIFLAWARAGVRVYLPFSVSVSPCCPRRYVSPNGAVSPDLSIAPRSHFKSVLAFLAFCTPVISALSRDTISLSLSW